jgi:hypothetical protein
MAVFASYRPELHYMRGPGPKWHEKHTGGPPNEQFHFGRADKAARDQCNRVLTMDVRCRRSERTCLTGLYQAFR